jgi:predicted N-acyltransferase
MNKITQYLSDKKNNFCLRRTPVEFPMSFHDSIFQVKEEHWNEVQKVSNNLYLSYEYLKGVEESQQNISFRYMIFYKEKKPVAIAYVQVLQIKLADTIKDTECTHLNFGKGLLGGKNSKFLVCGNVFASGENGFAFTSDLAIEEAYKALMTGLYRLRRSEKILGEVSSVIVKEFWEKSYDKLSILKSYDYRDFEIEPNMVLKMQSNWKSVDDYLNEITKKYRKKYKDVKKKSDLLEVREFTAQEIKKHEEEIKILFDAVHEKADFKFGHFDASGFYNLKVNLKEQLIFKAYFLEGVMVGFASLFLNGKTLDANYVGLDYEKNIDYAVYHRMLLDFVEIAIDNHCESLCYGRTASEIKSSVGAEPVNMKIFMRHRNTFSNKLIKPLFKLLQPSPFEKRNPFKEVAVS